MPRATPATPASSPGIRTATRPGALPEGDAWFQPLEEQENFIRVLYYGKEGSGKTTHACRAANMNQGRVLVIRAEAGLKTMALRTQGVAVENLVAYPAKSGERITRAGLDAVYRRVASDLEKDPNSWYAVIWDSVTEIVTSVVDEVQASRVKKLIEKGREPDPFFTDREDYGTMTKMVRDLLRKYHALDCHLIVTALERRDVDEDTKKPMYGPAVTPALMTDLLGYVDMVLACKAPDEIGPARAYTRKVAKFRAKDRYGVLPPRMAEPTFDRIYAYLDDELHEDTDPVQKTLSAKAATADDVKADLDDTQEKE